MHMNDYERWLQGWLERQAQRAAQRQAALEQARQEWVGRRVWYESRVSRGYAWVTGIDEQGWARLHLEGSSSDFPEQMMLRFEILGVSIRHV
jgi:hypothetical protein